MFYNGERYYFTRMGTLPTTDRGFAKHASKFPFFKVTPGPNKRKMEKVKI